MQNDDRENDNDDRQEFKGFPRVFMGRALSRNDATAASGEAKFAITMACHDARPGG